MPKRYINCREIRPDLWRARFSYPKDPITGVKRPDKDFYGKTAEEADRKRADYAVAHRGDERTTFGDFIRNKFLPHEKARWEANELSWTRYSHRESRMRRFFLEYPKAAKLRSRTLSDVYPQNIEDYFEDLLKDRQVTTETRHLIRQDFILALKACKRRLPELLSDYFENIPAPKIIPGKKELFDPEEIFDAIEDDSISLEDRLPVAFIFMLNCRPSEMFALWWSHINWREATVTFEQAMVQVPKGFAIRHHTKNGEDSDRTIPLNPTLLKMLRQVRKDRIRRRVTSDFVFCDEQGDPYDKDRFAYVWERIRRILGLRMGPTFYSLKTIGNSFALANGATAAAQAEKMGHSTTRMAEKAYRKVLKSEVVRSVDLFERKKKGKVVNRLRD